MSTQSSLPSGVAVTGNGQPHNDGSPNPPSNTEHVPSTSGPTAGIEGHSQPTPAMGYGTDQTAFTAVTNQVAMAPVVSPSSANIRPEPRRITDEVRPSSDGFVTGRTSFRSASITNRTVVTDPGVTGPSRVLPIPLEVHETTSARSASSSVLRQQSDMKENLTNATNRVEIRMRLFSAQPNDLNKSDLEDEVARLAQQYDEVEQYIDEYDGSPMRSLKLRHDLLCSSFKIFLTNEAIGARA